MASRKPRKRRTYHHGNARAELLEVGSELIEERGTAGFSLREAARRVGIDPAACYRYFPSREDLLVAIAQLGFGELAHRMAAARARATGAEDALVALGRAYVAFAVDRPAFFRAMFGGAGLDARDQRMRPPDLDMSGYEQLEDAIREWSAARGAPVDVESTALTLWAGVHGLARLVVDGAVKLTKKDLHAAVDRTARAILHGIGPT